MQSDFLDSGVEYVKAHIDARFNVRRGVVSVEGELQSKPVGMHFCTFEVTLYQEKHFQSK